MPFVYCLWVVLSAAGCAHVNVAQPPTVSASESSNNKTLHVHEGTNLNVMLHSSYWTIHGSSKPSVLQENGPARLLPAPPGATCEPGVGCRTVEAAFTAEQPGTAVVTASRTACGEVMMCASDQRSYKLTVVVTK